MIPFWEITTEDLLQYIKDRLVRFLKYNLKRQIALIFFIVLGLFLISGVYQVQEGHQALILRFGKCVRIESSGLHYKLPYPIEESHIRNVQISRQFEIGSDNAGEWGEASNILTNDENLLRLRCVVTWHINDMKNFITKIRSPENVIGKISQSCIREVISDCPISDVLSDKKQEIGEKIQTLAQKIADQYESGIAIEKVQLLAAEPPNEVINAYRDVQSSRADKENKINEAYAYRNTIVTEAQGQANKMVKEAEAQRQYLILKAEGDVKCFDAILSAYQANRNITKHRIFVDYLAEILQLNKKVIIDSSDKTLSHISLSELLNKKQNK